MEQPILQRLPAYQGYGVKGTVLRVVRANGGWAIQSRRPDDQLVNLWLEVKGLVGVFPTLQSIRFALTGITGTDSSVVSGIHAYERRYIVNGRRYTLTRDDECSTAYFHGYRTGPRVRTDNGGYALEILQYDRSYRCVGIYPTIRAAITAYDE